MRRYYYGLVISVFTLISFFIISGNLADKNGLSDFTKWKIEKKKISKPKPGDPDKAMQWYYEQRAYPQGFIPIDWKYAALKEMDNMQLNKGTSSLTWSLLGPTNIGGRIRAIAVHPTNPEIVYLGSVSGGVWKSVNGGDSWVSLKDDMENIAVCALAIDPSNPNIIYAGTGEGFFNADAIRGEGIFKSLDAGLTWERLASTINQNFYYVNKLVIDPSTGNIFAATRKGLYLSNDGGTTWTAKINNSGGADVHCTDVEVASTSPSIIIAAFGLFNQSYVWRSLDAGSTWNQIYNVSGRGRIELAVSKSNPSMMYSAHMSLTTYGIETISYSTNKGDSWTNANIPTGVYSGADNYAGGQGWYDNILRVDPDNANVLYAGGVDLWKSTNKGLNWVQISNWYVDPNAPQYVHADFHAIEFAPSNSNIMYIGNDGGIYRSDNKGISILHKNNNLAITQFYYGAVSATGTNYYGGTQDNGTIESNGGNPLWHDIIGGDGGATEVDYTNDNIIYGEYVNLAFFKSVDGGNSFNKSMSGIPTGPNYWDGTTDRTLFISPFVLDPNDANILVAGTYKLYKTINKAGNWTSISGDLTGDGTGTNGAKISAIAIAKGNSNIIYAGCTNGKIRVTQDNGTSWGLSSSSLPNAYCTRIAIDPTNPSVAYATYSGFVNGTKVFKTVDYGVNWTNISNNLPNIPVSCIIVNPTNTANLIVGTDLGIFSSENSGASWSRDNNGLPNVAVLDLDYRASDNKIFASTHGRSMFVANLGSGSNISEISYDDGTPTNSYYWNQWGQISANRITPPTLNSKLMKISIYIVSVSEGSATYKPVVLNMRNGLPEIQVANISSRTAQSIPGWDMTDVSAMDINLTGDFLVGMMYDGINKPTYGADPIDNNRAWDYNGTAWSPWTETYFMRATVQTVTAIVDIDTKVPKDFIISQNYPNPFNPTTTINYSLPVNEKVEVIVYDITGRKVAELVNNYQNAGTYTVTWNGKNDAGKNVSSGMYLYSIKAGKFNQVKKMILLK